MALNTQSSASSQNRLLSATYKSPINAPFTHTAEIPTPPTDTPADRTAYLGALRKATVTMQEQINKELTLRMEEDKARETDAVTGASIGKAKVDESKEEDNYGEEVVEED